MQFQADVLQTKINRSKIEEASALGAVLMNGFALKRWDDFKEVAAIRAGNDYILPEMPVSKVDKFYNGWKEAVKLSLSN